MLVPGTVLRDSYVIIRLIAQGGMGAVYLAKHQRLGSTVAVKETFFDDASLLKAFEREARLLASLRHAALPKVIDHFPEGEGHFLVMEFIAGDDLGEMLKHHVGAFPIGQVLDWGDQLLGALAYLHKQTPPVIHRDIKPQNLKLTDEGQIVLLDFGLAKGYAEGMSRMTAGHSIHGYTPNYAPLEQIQGTGTDARSDLYSLSATLYHLMTGFTPADAFSRAAVMVTGQPDPLRSANVLNMQVPKRVAHVLQQAMSQSREQRPASASEMRRMLREATVNDLPTEIAPTAPKIAAPLPNTFEPRKDSSPATIIRPSPIANPPSAQEAQSNNLTPRTEWEIHQPLPVTAPQAVQVIEATLLPKLAQMRHRRLWIVLGIIALLIGTVVFVVMSGKNSNTTNTSGTMNEAAKPTAKAAEPVMKSFDFDTVTVDVKGNITDRSKGQARYYTEDLGGVTLDMVEIPGGTFIMGSPADEVGREKNEGPQHLVTVSAFYMGKFEVTQAQWRAVAKLPKVNQVLNPDPSFFKGDNLPVEQVSWPDATEFCERLSKATGKTYRLPTEAEWEYACRAGTTTPFAFGKAITPQLENYDGRFFPLTSAAKGLDREATVPVGSLGVANLFGLFDVHGNVEEWCRDWYLENYYSHSPSADPTGPSSGSDRVGRGGSWIFNVPLVLRSSARAGVAPDYRGHYLGFRLVMALR